MPQIHEVLVEVVVTSSKWPKLLAACVVVFIVVYLSVLGVGRKIQQDQQEASTATTVAEANATAIAYTGIQATQEVQQATASAQMAIDSNPQQFLKATGITTQDTFRSSGYGFLVFTLTNQTTKRFLLVADYCTVPDAIESGQSIQITCFVSNLAPSILGLYNIKVIDANNPSKSWYFYPYTNRMEDHP